jgi:hypothetical protein
MALTIQLPWSKVHISFKLVNGRPMAKMVVENLGNIPGHYNFVVNQSDYEEFNLKYFFPAITTDCNIITAKSATKGTTNN